MLERARCHVYAKGAYQYCVVASRAFVFAIIYYFFTSETGRTKIIPTKLSKLEENAFSNVC
jgi:hypothetical protein